MLTMCGRATLPQPIDVVEGLLDAKASLAAKERWKPRYNITPSQELLVMHEPGQLELMQWGLRRRDGAQQINARAETLRAQQFQSKRCVVLLDGFYEWKRTGKVKTPYLVRIPGTELFGVAAIYRGQNCAIVTVPAEGDVAEIHDRMPLALSPEDYEKWITDPSLPLTLLDKRGLNFRLTEVSKAVNSPANDDPRVMEPVDEGELELPLERYVRRNKDEPGSEDEK